MTAPPALPLLPPGLYQMTNLGCLDSLRELRLDNNQLTKIDALDHLHNLTWLGTWPSCVCGCLRDRVCVCASECVVHVGGMVPDVPELPRHVPRLADLSFNNISVIEGLSTLTKLTDLSLFNNKIKAITGLGSLKALECLSIGKNLIPTYAAVRGILILLYSFVSPPSLSFPFPASFSFTALLPVLPLTLPSFPRISLLLALLSRRHSCCPPVPVQLAPLRGMKHIVSLNLTGNPVCEGHDYRLYCIAFLKNLLYLDYALIEQSEVCVSA